MPDPAWGRDDVARFRRKRDTARRDRRNLAAGTTGKQPVVRVLDPRVTVVRRVHVAEDRLEDAVAGGHTLFDGGKRQPRESLRLDRFDDLVRERLRDDDVAALFRQFTRELRGADVEQRSEGARFAVGVGDLEIVGDNARALHRDREHVPGAVVDCAPRRRQSDLLFDLTAQVCGEVRTVEHLDEEESYAEPGDKEDCDGRNSSKPDGRRGRAATPTWAHRPDLFAAAITVGPGLTGAR